MARSRFASVSITPTAGCILRTGAFCERKIRGSFTIVWLFNATAFSQRRSYNSATAINPSALPVA
jgi:hypothetical protein